MEDGPGAPPATTHGASGGDVFRRSRVRGGHGERGGGFGNDGGGGGGSATAKTSKLGHDDESPAEVLEAARREATLQPRSWWDIDTATAETRNSPLGFTGV